MRLNTWKPLYFCFRERRNVRMDDEGVFMVEWKQLTIVRVDSVA